MSDFGTPPPPLPPRFPEPPPPFVPGGSGPPWESAGMSLQSFIDTARGVLTDPVAAFGNMRRDGGLGPPLIFFLIGVVIAAIGSMIWSVTGLSGFPMGGSSIGSGAVGGLALIVIMPVFGVIGIFLMSFIVHFALGLFGGQKHPFETTFRTMAYAFGSSYPIAIIPFCGGLIGGIWGLIVAVIGLAQTQETTTGKSAAAVLTPTVLCCGLVAIFWTVMIAMFAVILGGAAASSM
jgi:hypothetical protein